MDLFLQLEFILRLLGSAVLGALVGLERESRRKEAGVRTHLIVCLASCLMMLVSKYGFYDMLGVNGIGLDPSRVAAGIVSGIGFLGAGIIFIRGRAVNGLTTAAGIWATVGVGMAVGAGLYLISAAAAVFIVGLQALLHCNLPMLRSKNTQLVKVRVEDREDAVARLTAAFAAAGAEILGVRAERREDGGLWVILELQAPARGSLSALLAPLVDLDIVRSMEW